MRKIYILLALIALMTSACQSVQSYTECQTRSLNLTAKSVVTPVAADLNVSSNRIKFEKDFVVTKSNGMNVTKAKQYALAEVMKQYKADVIVAPLVNVSAKDNNIHVVVYGYPATYTNFRKAKVEDFRRMKIGNKRK